MPRIQSLSRAGALSLLFLAALAVAPPASAHYELVAANPEDGATVTELTVLELEFSGPMLDVGTEIIATDSSGAATPLMTSQPEPTLVEATFPELPAGNVEIAWRVVAEDGHPIEGTLAVTYAPPAPSDTPSAPAEPTAEPSLIAAPIIAEPSPSPSSAEPGSSSLSPWIFAIAGLALVGAGVAVIINAVRRRPGDWSDPEA
jgi:methionine-rich copper-binding protein CopC